MIPLDVLARVPLAPLLAVQAMAVRRIYASGLPPMGLLALLPQPLRWILGAHADRLDKALAVTAAKDQHVLHIPFRLPHEPRYFAIDGYQPSLLAYAKWAYRLGQIGYSRPRRLRVRKTCLVNARL